MASTTDPSHVKAEPPDRRLALAEARLMAVLSAMRAGTLADLIQQHQGVVRRYEGSVLAPVLGSAGDELAPEQRLADAVSLWMRWAVWQLCPEQRATVDAIDRSCWLDRTSWRPALALACHFGLASIPDFRDRYRRRGDESAVDNLCGLWAVGPSTFYRYLDRGREQLARLLLDCRRSDRSALSQRAFVQAQLAPRQTFADAAARRAWHRLQAERCRVGGDSLSTLWHLAQGAEHDAFIALLHLHRAQLARHPDTAALVAGLEGAALSARQRFDLQLAQAALARHRGEERRELQHYAAALEVADAAQDPLMLGQAYGALGKFHEFRDADRAFACYEDSARFLQRAGLDGDETTAGDYAQTLVRLAWLYVSRNDPKARTVLDQAQALVDTHRLPESVWAALAQTWGEYWRRAGDLRQALDCKHRALLLYERLGDQRSVIVTYVNLSLLYGEAREFERALDYGRRVLASASKVALEPETLANVHGNLGVTHFWQGHYDDAIREYELALDICERSGLQTHLSTAHYNLAEAFYKRFQQTRDAEDERRGDTHAAVAMRASPTAKDQSHIEATRRLKSEILGAASEAPAYDRLLPEEFAAHFDQMQQVQRQRATLALPTSPADQVRARLAIAQAYLAIAAKEREAALALVQRHGLGDDFSAELAQLRATFERELTREERLAAQWKQRAGDLLSDERRAAVLAELLRQGSINKSGYAQASGLGLATASKHLGELAGRGLLEQTGKGPSTRYLPVASP